jgi:hypothetical protein
MMFVNKKFLIFLFKIVCVVFVCFMLYVFLKVLYTSEKVNSEMDKVGSGLMKETSFDIFKGSNMFFYDYVELINSREEEISEGKCYSQYMTYYVFALVLGAYVNVKKLYKLGAM